MPKRSYGRSLKSCVPVSKAGKPCPEKESQLRPIGLNQHHEARLITSLVDYYGWTLCADGNLYNPQPGVALEERDVA